MTNPINDYATPILEYVHNSIENSPKTNINEIKSEIMGLTNNFDNLDKKGQFNAFLKSIFAFILKTIKKL